MKRIVVFLNVVMMLNLLLTACATPTPEVIEKEVTKIVEIVVTEVEEKEVIVEGTPEVVEKETVVEKVVEEEVLKCELEILTQNTMLLPFVGECIDQRLPCIYDLIRNYDIVCLQEVWQERSQDGIVRFFSDFSLIRPEVDLGQVILSQKQDVAESGIENIIDARPDPSIQAQIVYDTFFVMGPDQANKNQDGGLLILSTSPIIKAGGFVFKDSSGYIVDGSIDFLSNKGVVYARIQIGTREEDYIHVLNTHLQAHNYPETRKKQLEELLQFIGKTTENDGHPILLCGDFNIDEYDGSEEYENLTTTLQLVDLEDLWSKHRTDNWFSPLSGSTWIGYDQKTELEPWGTLGNRLSQEKGTGQRIDYIFYKEGGRNGKPRLNPVFISRVPSTAPDRPYCFDGSSTRMLGYYITGKLKEELIAQLPLGVNSFYLGHLEGEMRIELEREVKKWGYGELQPEAFIRKDGTDYILDNCDPKGRFILRKRLKPMPGEDWSTYREADLYVYRESYADQGCIRVSPQDDRQCENPSPTISDHLGLEAVLELTSKKGR